MTINLHVKGPFGQEAEEEAPKKPQVTVKLNARRSLDGNLMIFDHPEIDIVVQSEKRKIITFPTDEFGDHIYATQSRLFDFLQKKGIIELGTVQGGNIYGSLEAMIPEATEVNHAQVALLAISHWIEEERPYWEAKEDREKNFEEYMTEPDEEWSTELGEVPHAPLKGTVQRWPGSNAAAGMSGMYRG